MTKDRSGIKSILSIHTPRVVVAKKPRPSVQEMLEHEDQMNIYDPYWWLPDTPEGLLKPQETPKNKSGETPAQKEKMINDWLTRPPSPYEKATKKKIVDDHYKKAEQPKPKKMSIVRYVDTINKLYGNSEETPERAEQITGHKKYPVKPTERFNDRIQEQDRKQKARNNTTREKTDGQV